MKTNSILGKVSLSLLSIVEDKGPIDILSANIRIKAASETIKSEATQMHYDVQYARINERTNRKF